jgi:hypothetical protein
MINIPTVSEALRRINLQITQSATPRDQIMLEVYRDHWLAEVHNDIVAIMATLPHGPVSYRFDGIGLLIPKPMEFKTSDEARQLYQSAANRGLPMTGPFEQERWAFADWGMTFEGVNVSIIRGESLYVQPHALDPQGLYLIRCRTMSSHPIDVAQRRMLGEHVFSGSLLSIDSVDESAVAAMLK